MNNEEVEKAEIAVIKARAHTTPIVLLLLHRPQAGGAMASLAALKTPLGLLKILITVRPGGDIKAQGSFLDPVLHFFPSTFSEPSFRRPCVVTFNSPNNKYSGALSSLPAF